MDFGRKIRKLRKDKNMNQQDLAHALGLHLNTISHWENLEFPFADEKKLSRLAEVLGTPAGRKMTVGPLCRGRRRPVRRRRMTPGLRTSAKPRWTWKPS